MDKGRLETQEVEESKGEGAQATQATPAAEPPVQKRATVASVKGELDALRRDVEGDVLAWLGQLDVRLEEVELRTAAHNAALLGDVKTRLEIIEAESLSGRENVTAEMTARLEAVEGGIGTLADVMRSHITDTEGLPQSPAAAAGFAAPPEQPAGETTRTEDIEAMANVCQTMTDVLLVCRYLKNDPDLTDADRNRILSAATRAANVPITQGLQIRAGVRNVAE